MIKSGTIKLFNSAKGYGFIKQDDMAKDMFFHISDVKDISVDMLKEGLKVKYSIESDGSKVRAVNVSLEA